MIAIAILSIAIYALILPVAIPVCRERALNALFLIEHAPLINVKNPFDLPLHLSNSLNLVKL